MPEEINNYPKGTAATDIKSRGGAIELFQAKNNTYMDSEGRYWVGLGPTVMNPSHSKTARVGVKAAEMKYGTKLDIMVADEDGKIYYIPAVSGDGKEHSFPDGLYQTGVPFDNVGRSIDYKKDENNNYILDAQGNKIINEQKNMVEFIGKNITKKVYVGNNDPKSSINVTNNYSLIKIIVYDGVVNY